METSKHSVSRFPDTRLATIDLGRVAGRKHHVAALVELDVTRALAQLREQRARGEGVSFFAWFLATTARVIAQVPAMHSLRLGKSRLVAFDDVDISILVEREVDGAPVPLPVLIRACNRKAIGEVHDEIQAAKMRPLAGAGDAVLGAAKSQRWRLRLYYSLPGWLRTSLLRWFTQNPFRAQREMGTVVVTSVGSIAPVTGWFIPRSLHNLCFALGAIIKKPWVVEGNIEVRDVLHLTILFDHDVVDGAPAARFLGQLAAALEGGASVLEAEI